MAVSMASRAALPSSLALAIAALLVSSCFASRDASGIAGVNKMVTQDDDPKCEVLVPCNVKRCSIYCNSIGLVVEGFCTMKPDLQVYCCCPVVRAA
ncbi:hypothetical protein ACP70R_025994 [Stipagrostis hirtigluma subsp. patula]